MLGTLCVFNGVLVAIVGLLSFVYVDGTSGKVLAAGFWLCAGGLFGLARRLRRVDDWNWPAT